MARLDTFLRVATDQLASDLHFHAGKPPTIRYNGDLIPLPYRVLTEEETRRFVMEFLSPEQKQQLEREQELDFAYTLEGVARFRVNVFVQSSGLGAVFRIITNRLPTLEELRLPSSLAGLADLPRGLVLVTGPTGSGKTTTLAAMINRINCNMKRHIITIEDPIEYLHEPVQCVVTQREVGEHADSFAGALKSALREAPDVLVVGEMRDYETVGLALTAAEAGVLVFATLHTNSAPKAIDRLLGTCPVDVQDQVRGLLSVLLKGVVAQRLCRLASGEGRVAAIEVLLQTYSVSHMIREAKIHQIEAYLQTGPQSPGGMRCLESSLMQLVREGLVSIDTAKELANEPEAFNKLLLASKGIS